MTTIVEIPSRFSNHIKRVMDSRDEFMSKIRNCQITTYTVEYFASCFQGEPRQLKALQFRLYNFPSDHKPEMTQYMISWEDIPRNEGEDWQQFQRKVNQQLAEFLSDLKDQVNIVEGSL